MNNKLTPRNLQTRTRRSNTGRLLVLSPITFLSHVFVGIVCFYVGFITATATMSKKSENCPPQQQQQQRLSLENSVTSHEHLFPETLNGLFAGAARVARSDFAAHHPVGVPLDPTTPGNEDVLMLYTSPGTVPLRTTANTTLSSLVPSYSASDATKNCDTLKVILTRPNQDQCIAIMGQWESYHIHKFMRLPADTEGKLVIDRKNGVGSRDLPLRYVGRTHTWGGWRSVAPSAKMTNDYWSILQDYLTKLSSTLERLKPVAQAAAGSGNVVVIMVVNFGQSSLLFNFVCAARSRGLDLSHILLFATDKQTVELATSLGLHVFDVQDAFGKMPTEAARGYGDKAFTGMMMAKVYCVHLVSQLGYDLLFSDVDMVWYRNPLDYFDEKWQDWDFIFQDDGARSPRYAPLSPNTGFYFVRHNERTTYFFNVFVRMGDLVKKTKSHQEALTALLSEHMSSQGLRVKVFGRDEEDGRLFPGGWTYHKSKDYMKRLARGQVSPYIFHMSWTKNKDNKIKFFQQLGEWYLKSECADKQVGDIVDTSDCCAVEPIVTCHYRDKPSKIPCKDSPPIDKRGRSFW